MMLRSVARRTCEPQEPARILKWTGDGEPLAATRTRGSTFEVVDAALKTWLDEVDSAGGAELPMTLAVLKRR